MNRELENIFEVCLERVLGRGESLDSCLRDFPEHAAELKPLIETALATRRALDIKPSEEFKTRATSQFRIALAQASLSPPKKRTPFGIWLPRWAPVATLIIGLLATGGGTVAAAGYSMPDSPLYPVKMAAEQVQLGLTFSDVSKAELQMDLADRRVSEIVYLANKGDAEGIEATATKLDERLEDLAGLLSENGKTQEMSALAPSPPAPQVTTPAPTTARQAPMTAEAPASAPVPAPTSVPALPPNIGAAGEKSGKDAAGVEKVRRNFQTDAERTKLKTALMRYAANHPPVLEWALENAPESSKPALRQAIAALIRAYSESLRALED